MMNARQMCEVFNKRREVALAYCKKKGWNEKKVTPDQQKEIRQSKEWRSIIPTIMEGY